MPLSFRQTLMAGVCAGALFFAAPAAVRADVTDPARKYWDNSGIWISLEGGYNFLKSEKITWAETYDTSNNFTGTLTQKSPTSAGSWGIAVGFSVSKRFDVALRYSGLKSSQSSNYVNAFPNSELGPAIGPFRSFYYQGTVKTTQEMHEVDFEVGYNMDLGGRTKLRLIGGLKYVNFSQVTKVGFSYLPLGATTGTEVMESSYWGIGPKLGIDGKFMLAKMGSGYLTLIGGIHAAVLFGRSNQDITQGPLKFARSRTTTAFTFGGHLGLSYSFPLGNWAGTLTGGYKISQWYNIQNTLGAPDNGNGGTTTGLTHGKRRGNLLKHGPFLRFTVTF